MRLKLDRYPLLAPSERFGNRILILEEFSRMNLEGLRCDLFSVDQNVKCLQPAALAASKCAGQFDWLITANLELIAEPAARNSQSLAVEECPVNRAFLFVVVTGFALLVARV